ncbi:MAG: exo-alpha-sialidase, partial [Williamsia sp.]|nr:exo-alpha-sialidase [Williamsia sp.]
TKGMFLDAMDFSGRYGVVVGDPIRNKMFIAYTRDGGNSWRASANSVTLDSGEAFFASSGTNVKLLRVHRSLFRHAAVSGGTAAEFIGSKKTKLAMQQGKESQGANSIAVDEPSERVVVVGGDFANDKDTSGNCVVSADFGKSWHRPQTPPGGYRSCVAFIDEKKLVACGTSGVDVSEDGGENWKPVSGESFHVCGRAKYGTAVFLAGKDGRIGRME